MKKLLLCTAALTMFAVSALALNSSNVKADSNGSGSQTHTTFTIDNSGNHTVPVNPLEPQNELSNDGKDNNISDTGASGELTLDAVPSLLNFNKTNNQSESGNNTETIYNNENNNGKFYYTQVTDNRSDEPGWNLTATLSKPLQTSSGKMLNGSSITLNSNGKAKPAYGNIKDKNIESKTPQNSSPITLKQDDQTPQNVMNAEKNQGGLTWFDLFDSISLNYGQSSSGTYTGTITWNLNSSGLSDNGVSANKTTNNLSDSKVAVDHNSSQVQNK